MEKTNVMRILDSKKISYAPLTFQTEQAISGVEMADILGVPYAQTFKTLVTISGSKKNYVFMLPVDKELDLKKCAKAVGEKSIEMIKSKELLPLTGYIHGGCSPIGMKKLFKTVIDSSVLDCDEIVFSGGRIGYMVKLSPNDLKKLVPFIVADLIV